MYGVSKCVCVRVDMFVYVYECIVCLSVCMYMSKCVGLGVCPYRYVRVCVCMMCLSVCIHVCLCVCV